MPRRQGIEAKWAYPYRCLWEAPANFEFQHPLESLCKEIKRSDANAVVLSQFFHGTLGIDNADWEEYSFEFENMRDSGKGDLSRFREWYKQLDMIRARLPDEEANKLR